LTAAQAALATAAAALATGGACLAAVSALPPGAAPRERVGRVAAVAWAGAAALTIALVGVAGGVGARPPAAGVAAAVALAFAAAAWDARTRRIPNALTAAGAVALLVATAVGQGASWPWAVAGSVATGGLALAMHRWGGLGFGDVKLLAALGIVLGPLVGPLAFALAAAAAGAGVTARRLGRRLAPAARFAFAPYLAAATAAILVWTAAGR
jgi:prepilin signal peptidase PulO-like enzyme (type II secretory pathway)